MAILDWFNQKQEQQRKQSKGVQSERTKSSKARQPKKQTAQQTEVAENKEEIKKPLKLGEEVVGVKNTLTAGFQHIIHSAYITEKTTNMQPMGKYVFRIFPTANSTQVANAIKAIYKVHVRNVHIITLPEKRVRRGRYTATRTRYPKAIVTLKQGETIEVVPN
ncbi:MAG: 50S ribosomal protein L23 [Candidatus Spechtbacteria bacterium]|nr:50S ribosomal protein L23 [Candidatus Spechtbacteria bacterium]